jgi:hypothetical protein
VYGLRLKRDLPGMDWREFSTYVTGLLAADTRLYRATKPPENPDSPKGGAVDEW